MQEPIDKQFGGLPKLPHARRAVGVFLLIVACVILSLWIRSNNSADRMHGRIQGYSNFLVASKQGQVTAFCFKPHGHPSWWKWETRSYPVDDELSFPFGDARHSNVLQGFQLIGDQTYPVMRSTIEQSDGSAFAVLGAATATLEGSGIVVPYWFLVAVPATLGCLLLRRDLLRFRLSTMLIVVTLTAALMGLAWAIDHASNGVGSASDHGPSSLPLRKYPTTVAPPPMAKEPSS